MSPKNSRQEANPEISPSPSSPSSLGVMARRTFVGWVLGVSGAVVAGLLSVPLLRVALYPLFAKSGQAQWSDLGPTGQYASLVAPVRQMVKIQKVDGWQQTVSETVVYVTKDPRGQLQVLSAVCPHLGCQVAWNAGLHEFKCPCHGGTFAPDGRYITGPPPRSMDALPMAVQNGHLMVRYEYFRNLVPNKEAIG
jgi:Rieske Fe-S protein